jgi:hypothetical protein
MRQEPHRLVFLNETGTSTKMMRLRGRCSKGQRLYAKAPFGHWLTQTFVAGLRYSGLTAPWVIDGPVTRQIFEAFVETQLAPTLSYGDVMILDNFMPQLLHRSRIRIRLNDRCSNLNKASCIAARDRLDANFVNAICQRRTFRFPPYPNRIKLRMHFAWHGRRHYTPCGIPMQRFNISFARCIGSGYPQVSYSLLHESLRQANRAINDHDHREGEQNQQHRDARH